MYKSNLTGIDIDNASKKTSLRNLRLDTVFQITSNHVYFEEKEVYQPEIWDYIYIKRKGVKLTSVIIVN